ncbi:FtsK/SpoIIIE domain-containing protein [Sciscionella marina]|uniref:FtsK/SpoIIIE domain-containing protein n=1 Tax=Sciscionella marina TaxID=508770 RepID=UPI0003773F7E|nr:FtsK/SpoIIIE domain-containing protein [Sciscionella marina]
MSGEEQGTEVVPAVLDGEFVDDGAPKADAARPELSAARAGRWRVPQWLCSWQGVGRAVRELLTRAACSPVWFLRATARGAVLSLRSWRSWVKVTDFREAAESSEKLADKWTEIRALTLFRWKVTGAVVAVTLLAGLVGVVVYGWTAVWALLGTGSVALAITGRRKDGAPGRKAVLAGPRSLTWTMDPGVLVDAFRDAKLIGKDEWLRLVERANRQGDGWAVVVDLPATRKAADVIKHREALASALAVDEVQLIVDRVRGRGGHAGRVAMWVADDDPYAKPPIRNPLVVMESWNAWQPVPFGRDARDRKIDLPLVWTSLLVGAIPRQGKTFAARLAAAGLILDPFTMLYVYDGKGGKDWRAAETVAHRFVSGDEPEHVEAVRDGLVELVAETQRRFARMATLDDDVCPESKITPAISTERALGMPITAVIIDEVQVYLEDATKVDVGGKKTTLGAYIADLLTYLAKKGPAAGIVVILATQRPDSTTIPSRLRAVLGSRFALRVMDWRDSNIILGEQMNARGFDSSRLLATHKGVGILRPDGETEAGDNVLAMTVRTYFMPNDDWRAICERGRELRERAGTLTGHAIGQEPAPALGTANMAGVITASAVETGPDLSGIPEPLAAVLLYLHENANGREFVPTAELVEALELEATSFGKDMGELGCAPVRDRVTGEDGEQRRVRGYRTADIRDAVNRARQRSDLNGPVDGGDGDEP